MRKKVFGKKLSREIGTRRALFRSLIKAFVEYGKMATTKAKAKAVQPAIEKLVNLAKNKEVSSMRQAYAYLGNDQKTTAKLFDEVTKAFKNKKSGFTRITNLPRRPGDFAEMVRMEWTEKVEDSSKKKVESSKGRKSKDSKVLETEVVKEKPTLKSRMANLVKRKKD